MRALVVGEVPPELPGILTARAHLPVATPGPEAALEALVRGPTPDLVVLAASDAAACAAAIRTIRSHVRGERAALVALVPEAAVEPALDAGADQALPLPATRAHLVAAIAAAERAAARPPPGEHLGGDHELYFTRNPHPMWFFDVDTLRFVAVNDAAVAKYGWSRDEFLRMTLKDIRPPEDVERLLAVTSRVARGLDRSPGWRHRARDGRVFDVEIISYPVPYGGRACELVLAHDVSDRVRAERELEELRAHVAASERLAAVGTLAAGVAHEVASPLSFVLANLAHVEEGLRQAGGELAAELREAVEDAVEGARRVHRIAADLRGFARADAVLGPVELEGVVASALTLAASELRHRARTQVDVAGAPPALANEARLAQVVLNLLVNAAHAIPEGDAAANLVTVTARADGARVQLEVSDTGAGVPPEHRSRIFDPFFTTKPAGQGTGLGLWVCRRIVAELDGEIALVPGSSRGATFRVTLPAAGRAARSEPRPRGGGEEARG